MAAKDPEPAAPEEQQSASSTSKKRKSALAEIQVDLSLPEPPSKKARRALKKGKALPAKPAQGGDGGDKAVEDGKAGEVAGDGKKKKKKKKRSPYGVWIGNLPFTATKADLRKWLVENSGEAITEDLITRVHMPTTKPAAGAKKTTPENRGFAYVDFATYEANVAAIALSETELGGRKLLIKDSKNFEGRPEKEPEAAAETPNGTEKAASSSTKIFVGNLAFNTTEDDLYAHFEKCGKIRWVKVATFEDSGKCKGYGWVNFEEPEAAAWAVKGFVKVRETVETLEDFMDEDGDTKTTAEAEDDNDDDINNNKGTAANGAEEEGSDQSDEEGEDSKPKTTTPAKAKKQAAKRPARTRTRKWWVNQLLGRNLKIELAEDDQTRYQKRFGKGAAKAKKKKAGRGEGEDGQEGGQDQDGGEEGGQEKKKKKKKKDDNDKKQEQEQQQKGEISYANDISVARLTGAAVAHQGKKVVFD